MRVHRWILALAGRIVPRSLRADWRAEWDAEMQHRERSLARWSRSTWSTRLDLAGRAAGAIWDAVSLQSSHWHSLRHYARHWRLSLTAILSLAAAIAATVVGFATYYALLLRPPGVSDPDSLRTVHVRTELEPFGPLSLDEYRFYRANTSAFSDLAAYPYSISTVQFRSGQRNEQLLTTQVSNNYFQVLGVSAELGRLTFSGDDDGIVVSHALWKKLGGDPHLVGTSVHLNEQQVSIVGVAPARFGRMTLVWEPALWMPFATAARVLGTPPRMLTDRNERWLRLVGRLAPGVRESEALAELQVLSARLERAFPDTDTGRRAVLADVTVTPASDRGWMASMAGGLVTIVLLLLIVACANVTNLLLALASTRRAEMLMRGALGASRLQILVPLLRESTLLAFVAGLIGYAAGYVVLMELSAFKPQLGAFVPPPSVDFRPGLIVSAATLVVAIAAGVAIGMAPAWRAASEGVTASLARESSASEPRKGRARSILVAIQVAIASVALVGVGVSLSSLHELRHLSLGFSAPDLAVAGIDMRRSGYDARTGPQFYDRVRGHLGGLDWVQSVTLADGPPFGNGWGRDYVSGGVVPAHGQRGLETRYSVVDRHYFSTLGIDLLSGRTFDGRDRLEAPEVVVVNATMAERHWPGRDAVGQRVRIENGNRVAQVIGVVADGKYQDVMEPQLPFMYLALEQHYLNDVTAIARSRPNPPSPLEALVRGSGASSIARTLMQAEPGIVFGGIGLMTLNELLAVPLFLPRAVVAVVSAFGLLTLLLTGVGLYSTVFYSVSQRRREMGIRVTLGAQPRTLFAMVLRQTAWVASVGAVLGLGAGAAALPLVASLFFGIHPAEPLVIACAASATVAIAVLTAYLAARPWMRMNAVDLVER